MKIYKYEKNARSSDLYNLNYLLTLNVSVFKPSSGSMNFLYENTHIESRTRVYEITSGYS